MNPFAATVEQLDRFTPNPPSTYVRRHGDVLPRPGAMTPCVPDKASTECTGCARFRPSIGINADDRVMLTIDASTVLRAGERCRMFA